VAEHLGDPQAVGVLDESAVIKKGEKSAGVARQYCGLTGQVENCQVGVFFGYASPKGHALIDRALYLPAAWAEDRARRREARVPEAVEFATKPELAVQMWQRARDAGLQCPWITADEVYGRDPTLRHTLIHERQAYVLVVPKNQAWKRHRLDPAPQTVAEIAAGFGPRLWHRRSAGQGSKGPRLYDWACLPYGGRAEDGWQHWLLVRRSLVDATDLAYYLVFGPEGTTLEEMVRVAGARWTIEECFELGKGEVGLDHYEVRTFHGWYRHITLAMWALAFLGVTRVEIHAAEARADRAEARHAAGPHEGAAPPPRQLGPAVNGGETPRQVATARSLSLAAPLAPARTTRSRDASHPKKTPPCQSWSEFRQRRGL
jgi:SRSO17 transposase